MIESRSFSSYFPSGLACFRLNNNNKGSERYVCTRVLRFLRFSGFPGFPWNFLLFFFYFSLLPLPCAQLLDRKLHHRFFRLIEFHINFAVLTRETRSWDTSAPSHFHCEYSTTKMSNSSKYSHFWFRGRHGWNFQRANPRAMTNSRGLLSLSFYCYCGCCCW